MTAQPDAGAAGSLTLGGDLAVNRLGFGAMRITGRGIWGDPPDPEAARALLRRAVQLGVDFLDTAHSYGPETSERLIGETFDLSRDRVVVATKSGQQRPAPDRWEPDGRPETIRRECERSLELLRTDRIDLFQLHRPDPEVPFEESVGALKDLQAEGKVRHVGLSNVSVEQLDRARGLVEIVSVQNKYSFADRSHEPVLERCEELGIAFLPWRPLDGRSGALDEVAAKHGATPGQVALAWLLARSPVMLPIPGTSSREHLEENVAAAALRLDEEDLDRLSERPTTHA